MTAHTVKSLLEATLMEDFKAGEEALDEAFFVGPISALSEKSKSFKKNVENLPDFSLLKLIIPPTFSAVRRG